jgi:hypothetical protein
MVLDDTLERCCGFHCYVLSSQCLNMGPVMLDMTGHFYRSRHFSNAVREVGSNELYEGSKTSIWKPARSARARTLSSCSHTPCMLQRKVEAVQISVCAAEIEKRPGENHNKVIRCSAHRKPKTREKVRSLEAESHTNFGGVGAQKRQPFCRSEHLRRLYQT